MWLELEKRAPVRYIRPIHMRPIARFAWASLAYDVAVVAWGAYVRATGSGAGCGRHWPLCNGEAIPRSPTTATWIEFSHRLSSGGTLILAVVLVAWALRAFPPEHRVCRGAVAVLFLVLGEALIGAGLVLFGLVARDPSLLRGLSMSLHLVNTFALLAASAVTAWWAGGGGAPVLRGQRALGLALGLPIAAMFAVGATGGIAALGDTLFPSSSLATGLAQDFATGSHVFLRVRALHPMLAVVTAFAIVVGCGVARTLRPARSVRLLSRATGGLAVAQIGAGIFDVLTRAPVALQLTHLILADLVWIGLVLTLAAALGEAPGTALSQAENARRASGGVPGRAL
jgi:heme A synthase